MGLLSNSADAVFDRARGLSAPWQPSSASGGKDSTL